MSILQSFAASMRQEGLEGIRRGLIGRGIEIDGGLGPRRLVYADYVASGRALAQVEDLVRDRVLPFYANTHTEASFCGAATSRLREAARAEILRIVNGVAGCRVIFAGSGATTGINRLVGLLEIPERVRSGERVIVLLGPYEHHSNILPWRESGAEVSEIPEAEGGGIDLPALEAALEETVGAGLVIGAFSACSNVTGIVTDPDPVTRILKRHGAIAVWDYAGGGPYLDIDMSPAPDAAKDAVVLSPHKFPGGPGASGLLVIRDKITRRRSPTMPGGGTVSFVSPWSHEYVDRLEAREEGGTPNILGDIRAALTLLTKEAVGVPAIAERDHLLRARGLAVLRGEPRIELLAAEPGPDCLPIFSFRVRDGSGGLVHHQLVTLLLSACHGVQARGGCSCAGPYAHRLLGLDREASETLLRRLRAGEELEKPGWVRLNLSYLHDDAEIETILGAVVDVANRIETLAPLFEMDPATARFRPRAAAA